MSLKAPHVVILAAGIGSRLGRSHPKCLTVLKTGETILQRQLRLINQVNPASVTIVVGFESDTVRTVATALHPNTLFVENLQYRLTNTSKSLLKALEATNRHQDTLWLNGDVVFSETLLPQLLTNLHSSTVGVTNHQVGEEEIKYTLDEEGCIVQLSKTVPLEEAEGEGVGVNFVQAADSPRFIAALKAVQDDDYFEKAMEITALTKQISWVPYNLSDESLTAIEVDFEADLQAANASL